MDADFSLRCYDTRWNGHAIVAIVAIFLYVLGIPLGTYVLLRHYLKRRILYPPENAKIARVSDEQHAVMDAFGGLCHQYNVRTFWCVEGARSADHQRRTAAPGGAAHARCSSASRPPASHRTMS